MDENGQIRLTREKLVELLKETHELGRLGLKWEDIEKIIAPIAPLTSHS
ncbi:hypothetical protein HY990_03670 [Candidatus Micrarchaeota archaeon]|nr:hypothetical protein [Candidatus Micrarchaeota archaeon]